MNQSFYKTSISPHRPPPLPWSRMQNGVHGFVQIFTSYLYQLVLDFQIFRTKSTVMTLKMGQGHCFLTSNLIWHLSLLDFTLSDLTPTQISQILHNSYPTSNDTCPNRNLHLPSLNQTPTLIIYDMAEHLILNSFICIQFLLE